MSRRSAALTIPVLTVLVMVLAAGCGSDSSTSGDTTTTKVIKVTISGDSVTPNGTRVEVAVNQPIELDVTADKAGEIHVHSDPEQELEYKAGQTKLTMTPLDHPGVVEVESHALEKTIVQLEAS